MVETPQVSLFASSIRPHLYKDFFSSLKGTSVKVEVVFAGNVESEKLDEFMLWYNTEMPEISFRYIRTTNIKPAQCYEVALRACVGETIVWVADDCEFPDDVIGQAYKFWKSRDNEKCVVSIETKENYGRWIQCGKDHHKFDNVHPHAPKMAPLGMMSREYANKLGCIDRRYISGQWDNDLLMRVYNDGGKVEHFSRGVIKLDHTNKHDPKWGITAARPFGQGFKHDRNILETAWIKDGFLAKTPPYPRYDGGFEPYEDKDLLTKSQSFNIPELWND